jgi:hypothetical protein
LVSDPETALAVEAEIQQHEVGDATRRRARCIPAARRDADHAESLVLEPVLDGLGEQAMVVHDDEDADSLPTPRASAFVVPPSRERVIRPIVRHPQRCGSSLDRKRL